MCIRDRVVGTISQKLSKPSAKTLIRKGKVQELAAAVKALSAGLVVFDHDLTPAQIRELEKACVVKILDRSELILDIFASRAATLEAKLQVEIAQLQSPTHGCGRCGTTWGRSPVAPL